MVARKARLWYNVRTNMNMPDIEFLGWTRPVIELVAEKLLHGLQNAQTAPQYRRATVVVPTTESGRRLREYMAESAGCPILLPRIVLAHQLISTRGEHVATEDETVAAWLEVLKTGNFNNLLPHNEVFTSDVWLLDSINHLRNIRRRLEKEGCTPAAVAEQIRNRKLAKMADKKVSASALRVLDEECGKWEEMVRLHAAVDALLVQHGITPQETAAAACVANPSLPGNSTLLILACVPELTKQLQQFLASVHSSGTAEVRVWVNAPAEERCHFDEWGQPDAKYWSSCPVRIPQALAFDAEGHVVNEKSTLHLMDDGDDAGAECVRLVREVYDKAGAGAELNPDASFVISCCDSAFTPRLHAAFRMAGGEDWVLNIPEGRSLLTMDAAHLFGQLAAACRAFVNIPTYDETGGKILHNNMVQPDTFCALLKNRALMHMLPAAHEREIVSRGFFYHLEALTQCFLPGSVSRLLYLLDPKNKLDISSKDNTDQHNLLKERHPSYYNYAKAVAELVQQCCASRLSSAVLEVLSSGILSLPSEPYMQKALRKLVQPVNSLMMAKHPSISLLNYPTLALEYLHAQVAQIAKGALPETRREETELDVPGWKELPYYRGRRLIINAMHDGCVPEPVPGEELLPESLSAELGLPHSLHREARDAYLLTALLHSRPAGEVHFVLARQSADGTPLSASTLLLRCGTDKAGLKELAERANYLFADSERVKLPPEPEICPLRSVNATASSEKIAPGAMESVELILREGERNPYAPSTDGSISRHFSPSSLAVFLECPLTFWIKNALQIDPSSNHVENKTEPESAEYGTGVHAVLDKLVAQYPSLAVLRATCPQCATDEDYVAHIYARAEKLADSFLATAYAENGVFTLPLQVRHSIMKRTLEQFVRWHVKDLMDGWCNVARELKVAPTMQVDADTCVGFNMTIDRVDYNTNTGQWRVLDYKTSSEAKEPRKVHYEEVPDGEKSVFCRFMNLAEEPDFPICTASSSKSSRYYRWCNVQLPLYSYALLQLSTAQFLQLLQQQEQGLTEEMAQLLAARPADAPLLSDVLPEMGYCSLATKTQEVSYHSLMNQEEMTAPRAHFHFEADCRSHYESAMRTVCSAAKLISKGLCLFSAVSLELKKKPYAVFGALAPSTDPRDIFALPQLDK